MKWQQQILDKPEFRLRSMLLVSDPDGILHEPVVSQGLVELGWEVIEYRDAVTFRSLYENKYRQLREARLLVRVADSDLSQLPYDIWKTGHKLELSLRRIFPKLSYTVLKQVDSELLAVVYREYQDYDGGDLGDQATKDFILERVYGLYSRNIRDLTSLLSALLQIHYQGLNLPGVLSQRLAAVMPYRSELPVQELASNREKFFTFLQEQWAKFVQGDKTCLVPFNSESIRVYVDSLFLEGLLQPVAGANRELPAWARVGLVADTPTQEHVDKAVEKLQVAVATASTYRQWQTVCRLLAEGIYWANKLGVDTTALDQIWCQAEDKFYAWLEKMYGGLSSLSYFNGPVMVHHIPWYLEAERRKGRKRVALLVIDGMAMDQWLVIKEALPTKDVSVTESACYAWVPTTTAISRQAMFAGEIPVNISDYLSNTNREDKLWQMFWKNHHLRQHNIYYQRGLGQGDTDEIAVALEDSRIQVAGLIIDTIDRLCHGEILGSQGLHSQIRVWLKRRFLTKLLDKLLNLGFHVYITSDHGNIPAIGSGRPREGILVEDPGERVRIYSQEEFLQLGSQRATIWNAVGLPANMHILLAKGKTAFVQEGKAVIGHGGASITEVIVPFIHLWKED